MGALRSFLRGHRVVAAWLVLMALAVRIAVPVGFMPAATASGVAIVLCPAAGAVPGAGHGAMAGMHHSHGRDGPVRADSACPFAGLSLPSIGGADAIRIAARVVAIVAAGHRPPVALPARTIAHLRPPLRGPPAQG